MRRQLKRKDFRRDRDRKVKETRSIMNHMIRCAAGAAACLFLAAAAEGGDLYMEAAALLPGCGLCLLAGLSDGKVGWGDGLCTLILGLLAGAGPCIFAVSAGLLLLSLLCVSAVPESRLTTIQLARIHLTACRGGSLLRVS